MILLLPQCCAQAVHACNIPVFRYALERWRPDKTEVFLLRDRELTEAEQRILDEAELNGVDQGGRVNFRLKDIDLRDDAARNSSISKQLLSRLGSQDRANSPWVFVRSGVPGGDHVVVWQGELRNLPESGAFASPARSEISKRLLAGHAIVWVIVASSDDEKNERARKQLQSAIGALEGKIQLPDGIGLPGSELHSEVPLLLKYSTLEIAADDAEERYLINLATAMSDPDGERSEPMIIPIFGRGRALEIIHAGRISNDLVFDLTAFLSGACSCQVKEQNPGFDLHMDTDWELELYGEQGVSPPDESAGRNGRGKPKLLTIPPGRR